MGKYLLRRVLVSVPTLLVISLVVFGIIALAPGDPLSQFAANPAVPPEVREKIRHSLGLDQPWPVRYVKWLWSLLHGDLGYSFASRIPVIELIKQRLPNTLHVNFRGVIGAELLDKLPELAASTGSACHAGEVTLSSVLEAMQIPPALGMGAVRFSLGRYTTRQDIEQAVALIARVL